MSALSGDRYDHVNGVTGEYREDFRRKETSSLSKKMTEKQAECMLWTTNGST